MRKLLHAIFGHSFEVIDYTVMGAPIERCFYCGQYVVTYGSIMPQRMMINEDEARAISQFY